MLNCVTRYGELNRMTQFKGKAKKTETVTSGLFNYPLLMAADILLYDTSLVPVGEDQKQHLELTKRIAQRFNGLFGNVFREPEAYIAKTGSRIRSLVEPTKKMDKSDPDQRSFITLLDSPENIRKKLARAKTDSMGGFPIEDPDEGIANLVTIYSELTAEPKVDIVNRYGNRGYAAFKRDLTDRIIESLNPIQRRYNELRPQRRELSRLMKLGRDRALGISEKKMKAVRSALGLVEP